MGRHLGVVAVLAGTAVWGAMVVQAVALGAEGNGAPAVLAATGRERFEFAGEVVNQQGKAVAGAVVRATHRWPDGSYGWIDEVTTDARGRFRVDRAVARSGQQVGKDDGAMIRIEVEHPDYVYTRLEDVRQLPVEQQRALHLQVREGKTCRGTVVDEQGKPVAGAVVQAVFRKAYEFRRGTLTGPDGGFTLRSLVPYETEIQVIRIDRTGAEVAQKRVDLEKAEGPVTLTAKGVAWPAEKVRADLLGMTLVELDKGLADALLLPLPQGLLVLDPGSQAQRLGLPGLGVGDVLVRVGKFNPKPYVEYSAVGGVAGFAERVAAICEEQPRTDGGRFTVPLVYEYRTAEREGSMTTVMTLNEGDVAELRSVAGAKE